MNNPRHYHSSTGSTNQTDPPISPNLILFRQLHQPQVEIAHKNTASTESKADTHQTQTVDNLNPMIPPHLLYSSKKISALLSPLTTSSHPPEVDDYNIIEKNVDRNRYDDVTRENVKLDTFYTKSADASTRDNIALLEKYYSIKNEPEILYSGKESRENASIDITSMENVDEAEIVKMQYALDINYERNSPLTIPLQKTEI